MVRRGQAIFVKAFSSTIVQSCIIEKRGGQAPIERSGRAGQPGESPGRGRECRHAGGGGHDRQSCGGKGDARCAVSVQLRYYRVAAHADGRRGFLSDHHRGRFTDPAAPQSLCPGARCFWNERGIPAVGMGITPFQSPGRRRGCLSPFGRGRILPDLRVLVNDQ